MNDPNKIELGNFQFEYVENNWIYKASPLKRIVLPERSKFRITDSIENNYLDHFDNCIVDGTKEIIKYLD